MKAIELFDEQDDNGFEFRSRTQPSIHCLLLQGPSSNSSFLTVMPPLVANS